MIYPYIAYILIVGSIFLFSDKSVKPEHSHVFDPKGSYDTVFIRPNNSFFVRYKDGCELEISEKEFYSIDK